MAFTMQDVVDQGRKPLGDDDKVRYTDETLLAYANNSILFLRGRRPDLFIGQWAALPQQLVLGAAFPLPDELFPAVADYVTARAETHNDESVVKERAAAFFALAGGQV